MSDKKIVIKGARVNNLKNIDVEIPRGKLVVITGLSGSGKSSLAFDTLYAEGQRRYVESLSSYARQFLGKMAKPDCDFIKGLPPAIAIEQKVTTRNSRSTVGTSTEIYDYLRLLFARIGKTYSPVSGELVKKHTSADVLNFINAYPLGTRIAILASINMPKDRSFATHLDILLKGGYSRLEYEGKFISISDLMPNADEVDYRKYRLLIDRIAVTRSKEDDMRILDSLSTAFFEGQDECVIMAWLSDGSIETKEFSKRFEADGIKFQEPSDLMFNFNNPIGACPMCEGFGKVTGIDENLVVPNKALSVYDDAVACWKGKIMGEWKDQFVRHAVPAGFLVHTPYNQISDEQRHLLWHGDRFTKGINAFFDFVQSKSYSIQYRVMLARYRGKTTCPECGGTRLRKDAQYVKINGVTISDMVRMPISTLLKWFESLSLDEADAIIARKLQVEITSRLRFLEEVGLGYLTLDRISSTLSGGESQRISLTTSLGSSLVGSIYILDEPSIGLHSRDTSRLINVLKMLRDIGNTVVVVEHDEDIIRAADYLIDIGPDAGRHGGEIVYAGPLNTDAKADRSYTLKYLSGELSIDVPPLRRKWNKYIEVKGASENNLKGIDVKFPLGVITVVTGVSGSGKSTLVNQILYRSLARRLDINVDAPGACLSVTGDLNMIGGIDYVDQNPIGKSSRSNPATYLKAFDEIRHLFAEQQLAKQMGYSAGYFSFNAPGGRCEDCKGEGTITIEMQFMADITLECESCHGKRYSQSALEVEYRGKNIYDVLNMTVNQAVEFFSERAGTTERRIVKRLKPLQDVGLGYIKLGQSSSSLSGGENQRVKLAYYLCDDRKEPTLFIFDEPTTGLHFHDISTLMKSFNQLIEHGHSIIIIEHNIDVIKCADYVIDMGPEGGDKGGNIVATGTPEEIAKCPESYTGHFLAEKLTSQR